MRNLSCFLARLRRYALSAVCCALAIGIAASTPSFAAPARPGTAPSSSAPTKPPTGSDADKGAAAGAINADKLFAAIVKVETVAVPDARSAATLGREREGTGIVIGEGGLILTIGYLLVEAGEVKVTDSRGRVLPAQVVGYDHPTGLGLVRSLVPLRAAPIALGDSERLVEREPVMIANQAGADEVSFVWVVSRRAFTGSWEYMLDQAIFTSPPADNWSGAALIDKEGKLVGIGSLIVREATEGETKLPGNVFVPIDLLKPILADLVKTGKRAGPARPWLGISAEEGQGRLYVTRVSPGGPADRAGVKAGDIILGVGSDGVRTQAEFYRKVWIRGSAGDEIPLRLLQDIDVKDVRVRSIDRTEYFKPRTTY
jgi:S1-C subfamily serine protease